VLRILLSVLAIAATAAAQEPMPTFGTTVVLSSGLQGDIYFIHHNTKHLPDLTKHKPVGAIYTTHLNVPPQDFKQGFPGITNRYEWFAIDYNGKFWIETPGMYRFALTSDDGAELYIDGQLIIDNNGTHPPETRNGSLNLARGIHRIRVPYFQGPRFMVALILKVARPGEEDLKIFDTNDFKPPSNPDSWPETAH